MRAAIAPLVAPGARSGVFLDFDGTLSDIVPVASEARPVAGAAELLAELARSLEVVAVVSGRAAAQLLEWLGPDVEIWGVHGAQRALNGAVELSDAVRSYVPTMATVRAEAEDMLNAGGLEGLRVEDKTVVVTLHYRSAANRAAAARVVEDAARALADRHGLRVVGGRTAVELRPPVELSKAAVVRDRAREARLTAAMFVGDDSVDLPGFDALDELSEEGMNVVRVAVRSDEAPPELLARADLVVDGTPGVVELLRALGAASGGRR